MTLISFTIERQEVDQPDDCQAEEGMTWYKWVNSSYKLSGYTCNGVDNDVKYSGSNSAVYYGGFIKLDGTKIKGSDVIISGENYIGEQTYANPR